MTKPMPPSSDAAFDMSAMLQQLRLVVSSEPRPLTARWVAYEHACSSAVAQEVLEALLQECNDSLEALYVVTGTHAETSKMVVKVVPQSQVDSLCAKLTGAAKQLYAVSPHTQPRDSLGLHVHDAAQAQKLASGVVAGMKMDKKVSMYAANQSSLILGTDCARTTISRFPAASAAPSAAAPSATAPSCSVKAESGSDKASTAPSAMTAPSASPSKDKSAAKTKGGALASAFSKAPPKKAQAKSAPEPATAASALAKAKSAAAAPAQASNKSNKPSQAAQKKGVSQAAKQVLDDEQSDGDEDDKSPMQSRPRGAKRRVIVESDSDDDFDAAPSAAPAQQDTPMEEDGDAASAEEAPVVASTATKRGVQPTSEGSAVKKARVQGGSAGSQAAAPAAPKEANAASAGAHPEYGEPPAPDAVVQTLGGKPFWSWVNDKGEEVTKAITKGTQRAHHSAPASRTAPPSSKTAPPSGKTAASTKKAGSEKSSKPADTKKRTGKGGKLAGFGDIRSMFGK